MTKLIINIAPKKEPLIKELIIQLGGSVVEEKKSSSKKVPSNKTSAKKASNKKVEPTFLFGHGKDFDIDAEKLREEVWGRKF